MHREAAPEGANRHMYSWPNSAVFSTLFLLLTGDPKALSSCSFQRHRRALLCLLSRDIGRFRASPEVIHITDRARNST